MILLDYKDRRPLYEQVAEKLEELMVCGVLEENSQLPSVRSLAAELSINPNTIQRAYDKMERSGFVYSILKKGSFVSDMDSIRMIKKSQLRENLKVWTVEAKKVGVDREEVSDWILEGWAEEKSLEGEEESDDRSRESDETV